MLWDRQVSYLFTSADFGEVGGGRLYLAKELDNGAWGKATARRPVADVPDTNGQTIKVAPAALRAVAAAATSGDEVQFKVVSGPKGVRMVVATVERSGPRQPTIQMILAVA